jgi:hypothetical protein
VEQQNSRDGINSLETGTVQNHYPKEQRKINFQPFGQDGISFLDFLDIINPLQHIPIVSNIYRTITGDVIDPVSKIAGSALYGGPIGAAASLMDVILEYNTGSGIVETALTTGANKPQEEKNVSTVAAETGLPKTIDSYVSDQSHEENINTLINSVIPIINILSSNNFLTEAQNKHLILNELWLIHEKNYDNIKEQEYAKIRQRAVAYEKASSL